MFKFYFTFWIGFVYYRVFENLECLKILGAIRVTWSDFHIEDSRILGVIAQNTVVRDFCTPGVLRHWTRVLEGYELLCCLGRMCSCLQCQLFCLLVKRYLHMDRICIHKLDRILRTLQSLRGYTSHVYLAFLSSPNN
jgi:hypothetical protein